MRTRYQQILIGACGLAMSATMTLAGGTPAMATGSTDPDATASGSPESTAALRAALRRITDAGMPGAFAEVRDGRTTLRGASGVADVHTGRTVQPWFQHRAGSITKTFVATALLQLVGERRLDLDAPARRYLPDLSPPGVTVRMLLNHTSGIGDYDTVIFATDPDLDRHRNTTFRPRELVRIGLAAPRTGAPGELHSYSNTNYILAGLILEKVTGRPAAAEITRRIIRPLGLRQTYFPGTRTTIAGPHARAYLPWYEGELRDFTEYNMSWAWMAGELVSSTHDLNTFYRALLGGRLLRPGELAQLRQTVPMDPAHPEAGGYGLGIFKLQLPCGEVWGHDGGTFGHNTISLYSADDRRALTVALNLSFYRTSTDPHPIDIAIGQLLVGALCEPDAAVTARGAAELTLPWLNRSPVSAPSGATR